MIPQKTLKMAARPTVTVYNSSGKEAGSVALPAVLSAPIRTDVVHFVREYPTLLISLPRYTV